MVRVMDDGLGQVLLKDLVLETPAVQLLLHEQQSALVGVPQTALDGNGMQFGQMFR